MAKLITPFFPPAPPTHDPPEVQLIDAIAAAGLIPPTSVVLDGRIHRFKSSGGKDKAGWYIAFGDEVPAGRFGDWRAGIEVAWRAQTSRQLSAAEEIELARRLAEIKAQRDEEQKARHAVARDVVSHIWEDLDEADPEHPYLKRKGVHAHNARQTGDGRLCLPLFDWTTGEIASLQYIDEDGGKLYHAGGETKGKINVLHGNAGPIYVVEGFATGATVHEVTQHTVAIAYSASNLVHAVKAMRDEYGVDADIVVVADNDKGGVGQRGAEQAIATHGGRYVIPPQLGDANDYARSGKDLKALLEPHQVGDWLVAADDFAAQPAPIAWLVKGWLQANSLLMVHGPSGGGKTFVVLDWCMTMAAGLTDWRGLKVRPGPVVYLAGEGHHGLRGRVAAWKAHHQAQHLNMWLSRDGLDLNTPAGLAKTRDNIRTLSAPPVLIVVDTLHRFLSGDENSAQDAKTMLDACASLQGDFGCSVLLVHHTGVSEEAQARARGSSAWRGALDIEISVIPSKGDTPITVTQRKSKDAEVSEPVYGHLESVTIPGWIDEDGQPVTSAVFSPSDAPTRPEKESPLSKHRKTFENAWWDSGCEVEAGAPYVTRSALKAYLETGMGWKPATVAQALKPASPPGRFMRDLLDSGFLLPHRDGWVIAVPTRASALVVAKGSNG